MCDYCDGSNEQIDTEVDNLGYMTVSEDTRADAFAIGVHSHDADGRSTYLEFTVPCCPMCGRGLKGGAE